MIKDTNPDHYKVDDANFVEYMNDPKISGFGDWMFANGFNSGVWASSNWISVKDRLPEDDRQVLVVKQTKDGRKSIAMAYCNLDHMCMDPLTGKKWTEPYWCCGGSNNVLYWMDLPEIPEEEA